MIRLTSFHLVLFSFHFSCFVNLATLKVATSEESSLDIEVKKSKKATQVKESNKSRDEMRRH